MSRVRREGGGLLFVANVYAPASPARPAPADLVGLFIPHVAVA